MRFAGVVLFLLTLSSSAVKTVVGQSDCSNGLAGIENSGICCPRACGACGGSGCRNRPGGQEDCCTGFIADNGDLCSDSDRAPCIIDDGPVEESVCSNGLPGVDNGEVCCAMGCGVCGGSSCKNLPGGRDNCCTGAIADSGILCSESESAPCFMDDAPVGSGTCSNGISGVDSVNGDFCCPTLCGMCGGPGCSSFPGGADNCCTSVISQQDVLCSESGTAPCIINDVDPVCTNGLKGVQKNGVCCLAECRECGGSGCVMRPGGPEGCCRSEITDLCTDTNAAPCVIVR